MISGHTSDNTPVPAIAILTPRTHPNLSYLASYLERHGHDVFIVVETRTSEFNLPRKSRSQIIDRDTLTEDELASLLSRIDVAIVRVYQGFPGYVYKRLRKEGHAKFVEYGQAPLNSRIWPRLNSSIRASYRALRQRPIRSITCVLGEKSWGSEMPWASYFPHPGPPVNSFVTEETVRDPVRVVTVAKVGLPRKRLDLLLEALIRIDFKGELRVIGMLPKDASASPPSPNKFRHRLYAKRLSQLQEMAAAKFKLVFHTNLRHEDTLALISQCHVLALPSSNEPFAISPLEAMSFGKVVIISSDNGATDYVNHGTSGFIFRNRQLGSLQQSLLASMDERGRSEIRQNAIETVIRANGDERLARLLLKLLEG